MSWRFHPYFWATPDRWTKLLAETDPDPAFQAFRAGAARVCCSGAARVGSQVGHFLATNGEVRSGGSAPQVDRSPSAIAGERGASARHPGRLSPVFAWIPTSLVALYALPSCRCRPPSDAPVAMADELMPAEVATLLGIIEVCGAGRPSG